MIRGIMTFHCALKWTLLDARSPSVRACKWSPRTYTRDVITIADTLGQEAIADFPGED